MTARVVGLGQRAAADDGVGLAVIDALRARGVPDGVELHACAEASALVELLRTRAPVVLVDAVVGAGAPGEVVALDPDRIDGRGPTPLSTHGVGVVEALAIARALYPAEVSPRVSVVGVAIEPPGRYSPELSPAVARAVPRAAARALSLLAGGEGEGEGGGRGRGGGRRLREMHESQVARQILEAVLDRARAAGATRVRAVDGWVSESEALSAESLRLHFEAHAAGTVAERAALRLRLEHVAARCRACGARYLPAHHLLLCPACGATDGDLEGPLGLGVEAIEVE
jgi:hydrogenase nickel insertion protein HypA